MAISVAGNATTHFLYSPSFVLISHPEPYFSPWSHQTSNTRRGLGRSRVAISSLSHVFCGTKVPSMMHEATFDLKKKAAEVSNKLKGTSIFLLGMNCTMKSNMGKVLADVLKYYYFDSDSVVQQATIGDPSAKSFKERDDENFRESESEVLKQLSTMGRLVVCVGDGAVQSSTNLAILRDGISLWIDVPLDILTNEVLRADNSPPDIGTHQDDDPILEMEDLSSRYNELKGGYGTADASVSLLKVASQLGYDDFSSVSPEDMAVQALKEIEKLTRLKMMMEAAAKPF